MDRVWQKTLMEKAQALVAQRNSLEVKVTTSWDARVETRIAEALKRKAVKRRYEAKQLARKKTVRAKSQEAAVVGRGVDHSTSSEEASLDALDAHAVGQMSVGQLKQRLSRYQIDFTGCIEKRELVELLMTFMELRHKTVTGADSEKEDDLANVSEDESVPLTRWPSYVAAGEAMDVPGGAAQVGEAAEATVVEVEVGKLDELAASHVEVKEESSSASEGGTGSSELAGAHGRGSDVGRNRTGSGDLEGEVRGERQDGGGEEISIIAVTSSPDQFAKPLQLEKGTRLEVFWDDDGMWFSGCVTGWGQIMGHKIQYDDGDRGWEHLDKLRWRRLTADRATKTGVGLKREKGASPMALPVEHLTRATRSKRYDITVCRECQCASRVWCR